MNDPRVYALLSDVYALRAQCAPEVLDAALRHLDGREAAENAILRELIDVLQRWSRPSEESRPLPLARSEDHAPRDSAAEEVGELQAILSDLSFVPGRAELVAIGAQILGAAVVDPTDRKRGRAEILKRILRRFTLMGERERGLALSRLRRRYARDRRGSLAGWADNITSK